MITYTIYNEVLFLRSNLATDCQICNVILFGIFCYMFNTQVIRIICRLSMCSCPFLLFSFDTLYMLAFLQFWRTVERITNRIRDWNEDNHRYEYMRENHVMWFWYKFHGYWWQWFKMSIFCDTSRTINTRTMYDVMSNLLWYTVFETIYFVF